MEDENPDNDNVRVCVRCRPINEKEIQQGFTQVVKVDTVRKNITVNNTQPGNRGEPPKNFTFDQVYAQDSKQVDVYNETARPIVDFVLEGYNGTIFAYGQTGTGKTFTMEGVRSVPELRGIIPNSFAHIFGHIAKAEGDTRFLVRVSYLEIYNEEVRDLLGKDQHQRLEVKERPDIGVYVKDLSAFVVNNADDMDRIMTLGNKNRVTGATNMNLHSSRSHAIFTVTIECSEKGPDGEQHVKVGKLHLVDLAGSERQAKTGATGQRLKEATKINLSLSTLGNVISALVDGKSSHIPYRNSKLTRLLQDSLGGNSKTAMVANIGPADYNYDESISTLRYANRAKNIQNKARINEDPKDALLRQFQKEIEELRKQLEDGSDYEGSGSGSEEEVVGADGVKVRRKKKRSRKGNRAISKEKMDEIQAKINADRKKLEQQKDMAEEERNKVKEDLEMQENELKKYKDEQDALATKLAAIEKKIIVGGENLLEKAEEQERLLEESAKELQERKSKEEQLRKALHEKEQERLDIEEKYSSLQDEITGKTKKLKKVWTMLMQAKSETISHILHEETASFTCNVSSFAVAAEVMVETEDSDFVVTSMNGTECGLMDLDTRQHTDDPTTLEDMDADTTVTPFVTEDHTYNQPIRANPPKKNSRQKGVQTPKRWTSKPAVNVRSSGSQTAPVMVDKACQCDPTETVDNQQPLPQPAPKTTATLNDSFLSETSEPMEDDLMDEDYLPDYDEEEPDESDFDEEINIEEEDHHKERKYVVFESCLSQLLSVCRFCSGKAAVIRKRTIGTLVIFQAVCTQESEHIYSWISQPMKGGLPVGNLILSAAMLFSGSSPVKSVNTLKFSNIQTFCLRTFYTIQGLYLLPAISATWEKEQEEMFSSIQAAVNVGGDARCCSPGHTAKYGSYSLMDLETSKVLDIQLVQSSEVANSNAMELEGLKRCISRLQEEGIEISDFTTDRHPQVKKYMREQHPGTNHWYDVWHVAKGVKKKVEAASKKKQCDILGRWSQSISNHLYYCAASSNGDGELLVDMWKSVLNHVADIHTGHGSRFPDCQHGEIDGEREWIKKGSKPYKELKEVVERTGLVKDIQKLSPAHQTYSLESYHKICCFFATKFVHFFYLSMEGRLKLACLHYNENACKPQAVSKTGDPIWQVSRPKYKKGAPVAKQVKVAVTYGYIDRLMDEVLERRSLFKSYNESRADLKDVFASTPKPVSHKYETIDKKAVVSAHRSRFNRSDS